MQATIGNKIVDMLTFSTAYHFNFISLANVHLTICLLHPQSNVVLQFHEPQATYQQQWKGEEGLVKDFNCGKDRSVILQIRPFKYDVSTNFDAYWRLTTHIFPFFWFCSSLLPKQG